MADFSWFCSKTRMHMHYYFDGKIMEQLCLGPPAAPRPLRGAMVTKQRNKLFLVMPRGITGPR